MKAKFTFERIAFTILLLIASATFLVFQYQVRQEQNLKNAPVDVLTNWTLTVDNSKAFRAGDIVPVVSKFTKLLDIKPIKPARFVQCIKQEKIAESITKYNNKDYSLKNDDWDGKFIAPEGSGSADKGTNVTPVNIVLPYSLGQLPNVCRINFAPSYNVNEYHKNFQESQYSNPFLVEPRPGVSVLDSATTYVYTDSSEPNSGQAMINIVPEQGERVIIYQTPPDEEEQTVEPPQPGLIRGTVNGVTNFVKGLF